MNATIIRINSEKDNLYYGKCTIHINSGCKDMLVQLSIIIKTKRDQK